MKYLTAIGSLTLLCNASIGCDTPEPSADLSIGLQMLSIPAPQQQSDFVRVTLNNSGPDPIGPVKLTFQADARSTLSAEFEDGLGHCDWQMDYMLLQCTIPMLLVHSQQDLMLQVHNPQNATLLSGLISPQTVYKELDPSNNHAKLIVQVSEQTSPGG